MLLWPQPIQFKCVTFHLTLRPHNSFAVLNLLQVSLGTCAMQRRWLLAVTLGVLAMLMASYGIALGDWKSEIVKKAVGKAARAGIQEALEDAVKDAAFDAALRSAAVVGERADRDVRDALRRAEFGADARRAAEAAMTAADVASSLDAALDAVKAAKKINKARKVIKRIGK